MASDSAQTTIRRARPDPLDEGRASLRYSLRSGIATLDGARYSAPVLQPDRVELLRDGLSFAVIPAQPEAQIVSAPGGGADVLIRLLGAIRRMERIPSPEFRLRNSAAGLRAGSFVTIPEAMHTDWHVPGGQPRVLHLHLAASLTEMLREDAGHGEQTRLQPRINWDVPAAAATLDRMLRLATANGPLDRLERQGLGLKAVAEILRAQGALGNRPPIRAMTPARLRRVRSYIEENLDSEVCLEDMAACVGLSPSHFSRAFRAETGMSPYAWVVQARVERVKGQLLNSRKSLAEIALDCGFASQSHMTQTFSRTVGIPPARWRREVRQ